MRIALVSPYSWTYQGGVNRHVEALAEQFIARGEHVRVLAPWDPPDAISRRLHRSHPELREAPDYLVPLGRTVGIGANGAVSNLSAFPEGPVALRRELRAGDYDVVHVHEPLAPLIGWDAMTSREAPVVGTLPRLLHQGLPEPHCDSARRSPAAEPTLCADRRLRGRGLDGAPLVRRRVHDRPERRRHRGRSAGPEAAERRAAAALRRPRGGAQGAAGPARRFPGAGRACSRPPDRGRGRPRGDLPPRRRPGSDEAHRRARQGLGLDPLAPARSGRSALRAVSRRRELRHGPDRGDGRRNPRGRVGDRRIQRRRHQRRRWRPGPARRSAGARRGAAAARARARAARGDGRGRPPQRRALRLAADRRARSPRSTSARSSPRPRPIWPPEAFARRTGLIRIDGGPRRPRQAPALARADPATMRPAAGGASPARPASPSRASSASA